MARHSTREPLMVYANGEPVGTWECGHRGEHRLTYARSWTESPRGRPLSLSLPFLPGNRSHRGNAVPTYFENLLPDSVEILRRVQARFGAPTTGAFDLLREIGRDCVGARRVSHLHRRCSGENRALVPQRSMAAAPGSHPVHPHFQTAFRSGDRFQRRPVLLAGERVAL